MTRVMPPAYSFGLLGLNRDSDLQTSSAPPRTVCVMAKFDREGFQKMMAELNAEDRTGVVLRGPYEDMEPDLEYLPQLADAQFCRWACVDVHFC
jgi:hypothetical protein